MIELLIFIAGGVAGFVAGVLVYNNNKKLLQERLDAAEETLSETVELYEEKLAKIKKGTKK